MAQNTRVRRQTTLAINAFSQKLSFALSRGSQYREMYLRLSGTLTWAAGASNAAATLNRGDEWGLIQRIDIVADGSTILRSFTGHMLKLFNENAMLGQPRPSLQLGDGATAAPSFDSTLEIPFWITDAYQPVDFLLDSNKYGDLRIDVTIAAATDINSAAACTAVAATLDVVVYDSFGLAGQFSDTRISTLQQYCAGANTDFQFVLPVNPVYRGFVINMANGSTPAGTDLPTACTNVQIRSGPTTFFDMPWNLLSEMNTTRKRYQPDVVQLAANAANIGNAATLMRRAKSQLTDPRATVFLDLVGDGYMGEAIDSYGLSEVSLYFNMAAAAYITVLPWHFYPVRGKAG